MVRASCSNQDRGCKPLVPAPGSVGPSRRSLVVPQVLSDQLGARRHEGSDGRAITRLLTMRPSGHQPTHAHRCRSGARRGVDLNAPLGTAVVSGRPIRRSATPYVRRAHQDAWAGSCGAPLSAVVEAAHDGRGRHLMHGYGDRHRVRHDRPQRVELSRPEGVSQVVDRPDAAGGHRSDQLHHHDRDGDHPPRDPVEATRRPKSAEQE